MRKKRDLALVAGITKVLYGYAAGRESWRECVQW